MTTYTRDWLRTRLPGDEHANARWLYSVLAAECQRATYGVHVFTAEQLHKKHLLESFSIAKLLEYLDGAKLIRYCIKQADKNGQHARIHCVAVDMELNFEACIKPALRRSAYHIQEEEIPQQPEEAPTERIQALLPDGWHVLATRRKEFFVYRHTETGRHKRYYLANVNTLKKLSDEQIRAKIQEKSA